MIISCRDEDLCAKGNNLNKWYMTHSDIGILTCTESPHLVRVRKRSCFSLKYLFLSPQTQLECPNSFLKISSFVDINTAGSVPVKLHLKQWSLAWRSSCQGVIPPPWKFITQHMMSLKCTHLNISMVCRNVKCQHFILQLGWWRVGDFGDEARMCEASLLHWVAVNDFYHKGPTAAKVEIGFGHISIS